MHTTHLQLISKQANLVKLKKLMCCIAVLVAADAHEVNAGFYAGGSVGMNQVRAKNTYKNPSLTPAGSGSVSMKGIGFLAGIHGGYMLERNLKYFGFAELDASMGTNTVKGTLSSSGENAPIANVKVKRKFHVGPAVGVGMRFHPSLGVYAKIAYQWVKHDIKYDNVSFLEEKSFTKSALQGTPVFGAGLAYSYSPAILMQFEYNFGLKKDISISDDSGKVGGIVRSMTYSPSEHRLQLRVSYHFR